MLLLLCGVVMVLFGVFPLVIFACFLPGVLVGVFTFSSVLECPGVKLLNGLLGVFPGVRPDKD